MRKDAWSRFFFHHRGVVGNWEGRGAEHFWVPQAVMAFTGSAAKNKRDNGELVGSKWSAS